MIKGCQTDLYSYLNYRDFLRDITQELKQQKRFNLRSFAKKANIKAPGYLKMVIENKRNIKDDTAQGFCQALEMNEKEQKYFFILVHYNQTSDPDLKKKQFKKIDKLRPRSRSIMKEKKESRYFSRPYYVTIREMVVLKDFKEDYKWIAKRCFPSISPNQAREAVETLLELGLLSRDPNDKLIQNESFVMTQDEGLQAIETYHYHESMLDKARHALGEIPQEERNFYALTLPLPQSMFEEIKKEFFEFRDRIVQRVNNEAQEFEDVYQINFQLFPVSQRKKKDE